MAVWLLCILFSGCLAVPGVPTPHHPSQDLIDLALQTHGETRIVGGSDASIAEYPWQASLLASYSHICGAIILNKDFVLTAAHCVGGLNSASKIIVGTSIREDDLFGSVHFISEVVEHPDFQNSANTNNGAFPYDFAILRLATPIEFNSNKKAISLTNATNAQLANFNEDECVITGWGRLEGGGNLPTTLQKTNVKILTDRQCSSYAGSSLNNDIHICVNGAGSSGGCNGDSGGPLACKVGENWELAGVTSFVFGSCLTHYPTVYAETYNVKDWIRETMGLL